MKIFAALFLLIFLISCSKTDNDTKVICSSNCTTISGKFITVNNSPVANIRVSLNYRRSGGELGFGYKRKIVNTQSDQNGLFSKDFYLKDDEIGPLALGYFIVDIDDSKIDGNKYIRSSNLVGTTPLGFPIYSISKRDTVINRTFYIPTKAFIKVHLNNFIPQQTDDFFEVQTLYPFGPEIGTNTFLGSPYSTGFSGYGGFRATKLNNLLSVFVAEGEKNIVRIFKRKNGVNTSEDYPVVVPKNNTIELTYDY